MKISSRFSIAVHILSLLSIAKDAHCTSEFIAGSVNTNPVIIRRALGQLKKAGLVKDIKLNFFELVVTETITTPSLIIFI